MSTLTVAWETINKFEDLTFKDFQTTISERVPTYYEFEDDILAYVVAWQKQNRAPFECHGLITRAFEYEGDTAAYAVELTPEIREETATIRRFFQNKIMMRSLTNEHVSKWMACVTELLSSPNKIKDEYVKIIVTLPRFYKESKATEAIFKDCESIDPTIPYSSQLEDSFELIGEVIRESKNENELRRYFKNSKNQVLAVFLPSNSPAIPLWNYLLSKNNQIKIKTHASLGRQAGHDFHYYRLGNFYEISDANG